MPLFEYACPNCGHVFEKLVLRRTRNRPSALGADGIRSSRFTRHSPRPAAAGSQRAQCVRLPASADGCDSMEQAAPSFKKALIFSVSPSLEHP